MIRFKAHFCALAFVSLLTTMLWSAAAHAAIDPQTVPTFSLRARVVSVQGQAPAEESRFVFHFSGHAPRIATTGGNWTQPLVMDKAQVEANLKLYPNIYLRKLPMVVHLDLDHAKDTTQVQAQLTFDGSDQTIELEGDLFGPTLGVMIWRAEDGSPRAATMAQYNREHYWQALEGAAVPVEQRPKQFVFIDRFIGGDSDRRNWTQGLEELAKVGFSALMMPPGQVFKEILHEAGHTRTSWAVYNPPGYAFDYDEEITPEHIDQWAQKLAEPYLTNGWNPRDIAAYAMSDEPGWYFPVMFEKLKASPRGMQRFHDYLQSQSLAPADLGAKDWDSVMPIGRSSAQSLKQRRLFYWSVRFFAWDSARHFARSTQAMEKAFYPGMPIFTNWNFFAGRFYFPGPFAHNPDKQSPDSGMGSHDWLEFGRIRGGTMLWTEDWFNDAKAYQWSFYAAKLNSAGRLGNIPWGAYVVPRTSGDRESGLLQKMLTVAGSGGKTLKFFVFGPEYNFPGNCYSEKPGLLPKAAQATKMIGAAEELLWPGQPLRSPVAILSPRSSQPWDLMDTSDVRIYDATNTNLNGATMDYMAEVFDLYVALQHANVPVEFLDEDDLTAKGLADYQVVYVTQPNVPVEGQKALAAWIRAGGTLVTVPGAATADRYNEPDQSLGQSIGLEQKPFERQFVQDIRRLPEGPQVTRGNASWTSISQHSSLVRMPEGAKVVATFDDKSPAIVHAQVGDGHVVHFNFFPGLAYFRSSTSTQDRLPVGFNEQLRASMVEPVQLAGVTPSIAVNQALVETPVLLSEKGAAITLLNWTGQDVERLTLSMQLPFKPTSIESVRFGQLPLQFEDGKATTALRLEAADILLVRP